MTNQLAIVLGALVLLALGVDWFFADWSNSVFLMRKLLDLIEWLKFWR